MSTNPSNLVVVTGRLARDPQTWTNSNGSTTVRFTIMADRGYTDKNKVDSDAIPFKAYVRGEYGQSPFARLHQGDLATVTGALKLDRYQKNGEPVYELTVEPDRVRFLDTKEVVANRLAARLNSAQPAGAPAEPEPTEQADEPALV